MWLLPSPTVTIPFTFGRSFSGTGRAQRDWFSRVITTRWRQPVQLNHWSNQFRID
jgi:hypothetical protein